MRNSLKFIAKIFFAVIVTWLQCLSISYGNSITTVNYPTSVYIFDKFEISAIMTETYTNPYDPDEIDFKCEFISPSGKTYIHYGFYYTSMSTTSARPEVLTPGSSKWLVRFAPNETGTWKFRLIAVDDNETDYYPDYPFYGYKTFTCNPNPDNKSPIVVADERYLRHRNGDYFFPISANYAYYDGLSMVTDGVTNGTFEMKDSMDILSDLGINLIRLYIHTCSSIGIIGYDFYNDGNHLFFMDQRDSWRLDEIINYAESIDMYITLSLLDHAVFKDYNSVFWDNRNPFYEDSSEDPIESGDENGDCQEPEEFVYIGENSKSFEAVRNYFRYVISRWGYSSNIFAYETYNEPDNDGEDNYPATYVDSLENWQENVYNYISDIDPFDHMITTCLVNIEDYAGFVDNIDFLQLHLYMDYKDNREDSPPKLQTQPERLHSNVTSKINAFDIPVYIAEYGHFNSDNPFSEFDPLLYDMHNVNWSSLFYGGLSNSAFWWWKPFFKIANDASFTDYYYSGIANYMNEIGPLNETFEPNYSVQDNVVLHYLEDEDGTTFYGWLQDEAFTFQSLFFSADSTYVKNFEISTKPSYASTTFETDLAVGENCNYFINLFNTTTGELEESDIVASTNLNLTIDFESVIGDSYFSDAGFSITCKPTTGWVEKTTCPRQWNSLKNNSELIIDDQGNDIFFINSNKDVCHIYTNGGDIWSDSRISDANDKAVDGKGLVYNPTDGKVYYTGPSYKIYASSYSSGAWSSEKLFTGQTLYVDPNSKLVVSEDGSEIYFIDYFQYVSRLYKSGGSWNQERLNTSAKKSEPLSRGLLINPLDDMIYYVGENDGKIYRFQYYLGYWQSTVACLNQWNLARQDSELKRNGSGGNIYYINTNNKLCSLYKSGSTWYNSLLNTNAPTVKLGTNFTVDHSPTTIYYIGTDDEIYKMYYDGGWKYDNVTQTGYCQTGAENSLVTFGSNLYYTGNDDKIHDFRFVSTGAKKSTSVETLQETPKSIENSLKVYPNPLSTDNYLTVEIPSGIETGQLRVFDLKGQIVKELSTNSNINMIDVKDLNPGLYLLIFSHNNILESRKFIIE